MGNIRYRELSIGDLTCSKNSNVRCVGCVECIGCVGCIEYLECVGCVECIECVGCLECVRGV